jgi:hypothetical protein
MRTHFKKKTINLKPHTTANGKVLGALVPEKLTTFDFGCKHACVIQLFLLPVCLGGRKWEVSKSIDSVLDARTDLHGPKGM